MTDQDNKPIEFQGCCNLEGVMQAAAVALLHSDKLETQEQRMDLVAAALDMVRTICIDDMTHLIGIGSVPNDVVVQRLAETGAMIEEVRTRRLDRFFNLCELLKPHINLGYKIKDAA